MPYTSQIWHTFYNMVPHQPSNRLVFANMKGLSLLDSMNVLHNSIMSEVWESIYLIVIFISQRLLSALGTQSTSLNNQKCTVFSFS